MPDRNPARRLAHAVKADTQRGKDERDDARQRRAAEIDTAARERQTLTLERTAAIWVEQGWRIESQLPDQIVVAHGKPTNHVLHLILTIVTFGLWAIVWLLVALGGGVRRQIITRDPDGTVRTRKG